MVLQRIKQIVLALSMIALTAAGAGVLMWRAMAARAGEGQATSAKPVEGQATSAKPVGGQAAAVAKRERTGQIYIAVDRPEPRRTLAINGGLVEAVVRFLTGGAEPRAPPRPAAG